MKRFIALIDCDSFFVSCEQVRDESLQGKPVCVIGSTDGCILSRSKEAKKLGIKVGMPYFMAKEEYKQITYVCAHMGLYSEISEQVMDCLRQFSPDMEQYSIDEAFLDITGTEKMYKKGYLEIIEMIKEEVKEKTGISVSIGMSSSKTLAKLASDKAKDMRGIYYIKEEHIENVLKNTNIDEIWGIGRRNAKKLKQNGIFDAWAFVQKSDEWIRKIFGIVGIKMKRELLGECVSKVDSSEKLPDSIQKTATFKKSTSDIEVIKVNLKKHIHNACKKLRRHNGTASQIGVMLRTKDFKIIFDKKELLIPTNFEIEISKIATSLLDKLYIKDILYRSTGIVLEKLSFSECTQTNLFDGEKIIKNKNLANTIDKIEEKFGKNSIKIGF